jgi:hypothetical protein
MRNNLGYKIFALVITIFIWLQISLLREQNTTINIPVRIVGLTDNLYLYKNADVKIPVLVTGRGMYILMYYLSDPSIYYSGEDIRLGKYALDVKKIEKSIPTYSNLRFSVVDTEYSVEVTTDRIIQKKVPVIFEFISNKDKETLIADHYIFDDYFVTISGPGEEIQNIENIFTEHIKSDILKAKDKNIRLRPVNEHIVIVPPSIELMKTSDLVSSKTLAFIPILHNESKVTIFPERVTVKIEGKLDSLYSVVAEDIVAYIDGNITEDTDQVEVYFSKPKYIRIIDYTPKYVSLKKR